jgi:hypothetical protein
MNNLGTIFLSTARWQTGNVPVTEWDVEVVCMADGVDASRNEKVKQIIKKYKTKMLDELSNVF